jgi:hypothetical protein
MAFSTNRPSWVVRIVSIKNIGKELRTNVAWGASGQRMLQTITVENPNFCLWAVSFEAAFNPTAEQGGSSPGFGRHWLQLRYTNKRDAKPFLAENHGFWDGRDDSWICHEHWIMVSPLKTNLIIAAPTDLLKRPKLYLCFLDYPKMVLDLQKKP